MIGSRQQQYLFIKVFSKNNFTKMTDAFAEIVESIRESSDEFQVFREMIEDDLR